MILGVKNPSGLVDQLSMLTPQSLVDDRLLRLWDRLSILESNVNWRLYGLPARLVNIKLEQAGILAGSGDVESALEIFKKHQPRIRIPDFLVEKASQAQSIFMIPGDNNNEWNSIKSNLRLDAKVTLVDDSSDLFRYKEDSELCENKQVKILRVSAIDSSARFIKPEFEIIWLSSILNRLTPLQTIIVLKRSHSAIIPGGICAGLVQTNTHDNSWPDPRWMNTFHRESMENFFKILKFSNFKIEQADNFVSFRFSKK